MQKEFYCKCGYHSADKKEMNRHINEKCVVEKGMHGRVKEAPPLPAQPPSLPATEATKQAEQKTVNPSKIKKPKSGSAFYLTLCIVFLAAGVGLFGAYFVTVQMIFGYIFIAPLIAGLICFYKYKKSREMATEVIYTEHLIPKTQVNSMNLYPRTGADKRGVVFEQVEKPGNLGQPWVCDNDSKPYFIGIFKNNNLGEFALPDEQYYDPRVYAERVLSLPAHRRIFLRKQNLLQKLSPFFLLLVIFAEWLIIITTTAPPPAGA